MKGLIKITRNENGQQLVSARELHEFLEVGRDFTTWIKERISKYGFTDTNDYTIINLVPQNGGASWGGSNKVDYALTIEMAKELSMVENNVNGRKARLYFIECEKELKQVYLNYEEIITQTYGKLYTVNDALDLLNNMRTVGNNLDVEGLFSFLIKDKVLTNKNVVTKNAINNRKAIEVNNEIYLAEKTLKKFIKNSTDGEFFNLKQVNPGKTFKEVVDSIKDLKYFEEIEE